MYYYKTKNLLYSIRLLENANINDLYFNQKFKIFRKENITDFYPEKYLLSLIPSKSIKIKKDAVFKNLKEFNELIIDNIDISSRKKYKWKGGNFLILVKKNYKQKDIIENVIKRVVMIKDVEIKASFLKDGRWEVGFIINNFRDIINIQFFSEHTDIDVFEQPGNFDVLKDLEDFYLKSYTPWNILILSRKSSSLAKNDMVFFMDNKKIIQTYQIPYDHFTGITHHVDFVLSDIHVSNIENVQNEKIKIKLSMSDLDPKNSYVTILQHQKDRIDRLKEQIRAEEGRLRVLEKKYDYLEKLSTTPVGLVKIRLDDASGMYWQSVLSNILSTLPDNNYSLQVFKGKNFYDLIAVDNDVFSGYKNQRKGHLESFLLNDHKLRLFVMDKSLFQEKGIILFYPKSGDKVKSFDLFNLNKDVFVNVLFNMIINANRMIKKIISDEPNPESETIEIYDTDMSRILEEEKIIGGKSTITVDHEIKDYFYIVEQEGSSINKKIFLTRYNRNYLISFDEILNKFLINANIEIIENFINTDDRRIKLFTDSKFMESLQNITYEKTNEDLYKDFNNNRIKYNEDTKKLHNEINVFNSSKMKFNLIVESTREAINKLEAIQLDAQDQLKEINTKLHSHDDGNKDFNKNK